MLFTACCRTSFQQICIIKCVDNKNIEKNISIPAIHIKPSTSVFITKWETYSSLLWHTWISAEISLIIFSTKPSVSSPCRSVCVILLGMVVYGVVSFFAVFYYFSVLNTNILITLLSDILTVITSLMKSHQT